ncbi:MAG: exodeoxyribonuclease VII large subunit [Gammaproteobacteria bacterium]
MKRRFPALPVLLYPVQVQGDGAATSVVQALTTAGQRQDCDVLLLVRGGGSLEDLQAFNEEAVARAIVQCEIPVVSGIGHESDVTIADFVADVRAATPSAAAELISPNQAEWLARFSQLEQRLSNVISRSLNQRQRQLDSLQQRLERQHPGRRLQQQAQRLDDLEQRLQRAMAARLRTLKTHQAGLQIRLLSQAPQQRITYTRQRWQGLNQRLQQAMERLIETKRQALSSQARALHNISPLQTLQRGYAIVRKPDGSLIRQAEQVQAGDPIEALLGAGKLLCTVDESYGDKSHHDD